MQRVNTALRPRSFGLVLLAIMGSSGCSESYPPIPESRRALVDDALSLLECGAIANPGVWSASSPTGPWDQGEVDVAGSAPCLRDMLHSDQLFGVSGDQLGRACQGGLAEGCTHGDRQVTCDNDQIFVPNTLIPDTLVGGDVGVGGLLSVLWHEAIHAQQSDRFGDCGIAREVEAYAQQIRFTGWLGVQLQGIDGRPIGSGDCTSSIDAAGLDPCLFESLTSMFPELDTSVPFPADACDDLREISAQLILRNREADNFIGDFRAAAAACDTVGSSSEPLRVASDEHDKEHEVFAGGSVISRYALLPDGTRVFESSFDSGLDEVTYLELAENLAGEEYLLLAGRIDGRGEIRLRGDSNSIEFPADGVFDYLATTLTTPAMMSVEDIIVGPDGSLLVWDIQGQRVFELADSTTLPGDLPGADTIPDAINPVPILQVPATDRAYTIAFASGESTAGAMAAAMLDPDPEQRSSMLQFADTDLDGIYTLVEETRLIESAFAPPNFVGRPVADQALLVVAGAPGNQIAVASVDEDVDLGNGVVGPAGRAEIPMSRALVAGETLQLTDATMGSAGASSVVDEWRPIVTHMSPVIVDAFGGDTVHIAGGQLATVIDVEVDGSSVPFSIIGDRQLDFTAPALGSPGSVVVRTSTERAHAGVIRPTHPLVRFDDTVEWSTWAAGAGDWSCGAGGTGPELPLSLDEDGCTFTGAVPSWDELLSPPIDLIPFQGQDLVVELIHRPSFGRQGDGGVLQARVGDDWQTLKPRGRPLRRIDSSSCGNGACEPGSPIHGDDGYARGAASNVWLTDEYEVPAALTELELRLVATDYAGDEATAWFVDRLDVRVDEGGTRLPPPSLPWQPIFELDCESWAAIYGDFFCDEQWWVPGANGSVIGFLGNQGRAEIPLDLTEIEQGQQVAIHLRHRFDFDPEGVTDMSGGWLALCDENGKACKYLHPSQGYPYGSGDSCGFGAFTDSGTEGAWVEDVFDISKYADAYPNAVLVVEAVSWSAYSPEGWAIDSIALDVR